MSLTISSVHDPASTDTSEGVFDITCDNNYTANGYLLAASDFARRSLYAVIPVQKGTANRIITYDPTSDTNGKLRVWTALGTEAAGASDQSLISCRVRVTGPR